MADKICYWDATDQTQKERDATPEEQAEIDLRRVGYAQQQFQARVKVFETNIQRNLDDFAASRGYDGIMSACTYALSTAPKFAAEGARCVSLRDETWGTCYQILAEVQAGTRPEPTYEELLLELPELTWLN